MAHIVYGSKGKKHAELIKINKSRQRRNIALYWSLAINVGLLLWLLIRR